MRFQRLMFLASVGLLTGLPMLLHFGCSGPSPTTPSIVSDFVPPPIDGGRVTKSDASAHVCNGSPDEGCPCENEQEMADCGRIYRQSGSYLSCSQGFITCSDGSWSACIGDQLISP